MLHKHGHIDKGMTQHDTRARNIFWKIRGK